MASATKSKDSNGKRDDADESGSAAPAPAKHGRSPLLLVSASVLIAAAAASGATWFLTARHVPAKHAATVRDAEAEAPAVADEDTSQGSAVAPAQYLELTPAFVVNMADEESMRFLQVEVQLMARDPKVIDAAKNNMPRIRNALMLLFSQQHAHDIAARTAKEALQKQALEEVQHALQAENAPSEVVAVYFTSFVMQ